MKLTDPDTGEVLARLQIAQGPLARMRGLIGRSPPEKGRGLAIAGRQVHTFGMRTPIDAAYLSAAGEILRVVRLEPWRLGPFDSRARWIVEMAAGEKERLGLEPGRIVVMEKP